MHIFIKVGGKIKGRKIKLLNKRIFALYMAFCHNLAIIFSKIFSLATLARLRLIPHLEMQACNVLLPTPFIFLFFFVSLFLTANFQKSLKTNKSACTKLPIKCPEIACGSGGGGDKKRGETREWGDSAMAVGGYTPLVNGQ